MGISLPFFCIVSFDLILTDPGLQRSGTRLHSFVAVVFLMLEDLLATKALVSPFKPSYRVCLLNNYLVETVRKYFVSTRCQKSEPGVIA